MKAEIIVKVADGNRFTNGRNRKETLCVLISSAVRSGDISNLANLVESKTEAQRAIDLYRERSQHREMA